MTSCYDMATGAAAWTHADEARFSDFVAGDGPRATPTVHQGRVYAYGATGILNCLDASSGELIWTRNVYDESTDSLPRWGNSCSPLIDGSRVIVTAGGGDGGGALIAFDQLTGDIVWSGGDDGPSYSSPVMATLAGVRQILIVGATHLSGPDPETGAVLWRQPWHPEHPNVSQAVPLNGDRVFLSAGYGQGCAVFQLASGRDGWSVHELWANLGLKTKFTNVVVRRGHVFGLDGGILACLDAETGQQRWKAGRYGHGQIILVGDVILVLAESGSVHLVEANPERHLELGRLDAFDSKTWNCPVLSGRRLLVRNDREAACYLLP
ncbi:MAG: PQQ-binding-like beta-propeller repeat protein [Pirellulales bacterium]